MASGSVNYNFQSGVGTVINNSQDDVIIAFMGLTGTGKSSFIGLVSGDPTVKTGNSLDSETSKIQVVRYVDPTTGRRIVMVDTPGFDDSRGGITDTDVLRDITDFLVQQYDQQRKLNGLVYLQRICDPRFTGQSNYNLRMFKELCGSENYKNVVVLTTFWDKAKKEGVEREEQLKTQHFKEVVAGGAKFMRHSLGNKETGMNLLRHIFTLLPTNVQIQEEICKEGKLLEETAAGSVHRTEIERLMVKHAKEMAALRAELQACQAKSAADKKAMEEELDRLRRRVEQLEGQKLNLKNGPKKILGTEVKQGGQAKRVTLQEQGSVARVAKEETRIREKEERERREKEQEELTKQLADWQAQARKAKLEEVARQQERERQERERRQQWEKEEQDRVKQQQSRKSFFSTFWSFWG